MAGSALHSSRSPLFISHRHGRRGTVATRHSSPRSQVRSRTRVLFRFQIRGKSNKRASSTHGAIMLVEHVIRVRLDPTLRLQGKQMGRQRQRTRTTCPVWLSAPPYRQVHRRSCALDCRQPTVAVGFRSAHMTGGLRELLCSFWRNII
jgi:hypothetical protein